MGDFNNIFQTQDRIGGKLVQEAEYIGLVNMIKKTKLFEKGSNGDHFTWSNNR